MAEIDDLKEILTEDSWALSYKGAECDGFEVVHVKQGEDRRWSRTNLVVVRAPSGKHYAYDYEQGLTEYQDVDAFGDGNPKPYEVIPVEKTVTITNYVKVDGG
ncbi:Uncharacterised protein [Mycobacteroides abscessus subsp. abscessus]|uniref:hypothetical protein n=1 Tax=Mycobacteroides abscessus TaxID=36809 RepID=UPI0009A67FDC|nr:hypothetical protein [Mycobacteroides abscessus]SKU46684.1 Uncharacterised protein [Mycobacteroides abscessus subsp. abscessus]